MKPKNLIILVIVIAVLLGVKYLFFPSQNQDGKDAGAPKSGPSLVSVTIVHPVKLSNEVYASGSILANDEVELQSEVSGKVVQLLFTEGSMVSKGQVLVRLNDAELQAQLKKNQVQAALASKTLERQKQLLQINGVSQETVDQAQSQYDILMAEQAAILAQLDKLSIKAPFSGTIGLRNISEGAFITPSTVIADLQQIEPLKVDFFIAEKYAAQVKVGDRLNFSVDGVDKQGVATVFAIDPQIDPDTRAVHIRARCANNDHSIFPGSFAKVQLSLKEIDSALMVPSESIVPELKGQKVFLVKNGKAVPSKVITGMRNDTSIQVTQGLHAGDSVVVTGVMGLRPDAPVKIKDPKKK